MLAIIMPLVADPWAYRSKREGCSDMAMALIKIILNRPCIIIMSII